MSCGNDVMQVDVVGTSAALEALNRSEVDMQIATAKKYPRSVSKVREKVLEIATCDQEVAESCFYALPRDGKTIEGPSVRLAEIVANSYGNIRVGARVIGEDKNFIVCQGVCIDMENNVSSSVEVRRRITNKHGNRYSDDMINTTANAGCSIAFRNAIFKTVPMAIFKDVQAKIKKVSMGDARTLNERRKAAVAWFEGKGVKKANIIATLNRSKAEDEPALRQVDDITLEHLQILNGIRNAVNDGDISIQEAFFAQQPETETDPLSPGRHNSRKPQQTKPEPMGEPEDSPESAEPTQEETAQTMQEPQEPETDGCQPDACADYRELFAANGRSKAMLARAIETARGKHRECEKVKEFCNIDYTDEDVCGLILTEFRRLKDLAKGKAGGA